MSRGRGNAGDAAGLEHLRRQAAQINDSRSRVSRLETTTRGKRWSAALYLDTAGAPTHTAAGYQQVGFGGGAGTLTVDYDVSPEDYPMIPTVANGRIYAPRRGRYLVIGASYFANLALGSLYGTNLRISLGGAAAISCAIQFSYSSGSACLTNASVETIMDEDDYVELWAYQNDTLAELYGAALPYGNRLSLSYVGPA